MNKRFLVAMRPTLGLEAAVFATCAVSPMESLEDVERELSKRQIAGKVVFDLLLANGHKSNRYFIGEFDGNRFRSDEFNSAQPQYETLSPVSAAILKNHFAEVSTSLLTPAMKYALRTGLPF